MKYKTHIKLVHALYGTFFGTMWCEEPRINHLTPLLVVTMPYTCWFLVVGGLYWGLHFRYGVAFWRVVMREVHYEGPNRIWRALKPSILNTTILQPKTPTEGIRSGRCDEPLMPRSHQCFRPVPAMKLMGIMLMNRYWPTTFHTIPDRDAGGWCNERRVWSARQPVCL